MCVGGAVQMDLRAKPVSTLAPYKILEALQKEEDQLAAEIKTSLKEVSLAKALFLWTWFLIAFAVFKSHMIDHVMQQNM